MSTDVPQVTKGIHLDKSSINCNKKNALNTPNLLNIKAQPILTSTLSEQLHRFTVG